MSHIQQAKVQPRNLDVLEGILPGFHARLVRGAKTHNWFGVSVGDYPLPPSVTKDELGKCDHKIVLEGCGYEIGLKQQKDGSYKMLYDFYGEGRKLKAAFGDNLNRLSQAYSVAMARHQAHLAGYIVGNQTKLASGKVQLQVVVP